VLCIVLFFCFFDIPLLHAQVSKASSSPTNVMPTPDQYKELAAEMERTLERDVLGVWFPRAVDKETGGFYANFTRDWQRTNSEGKFSVFQGRMVWVAAQVMIQRPDLRDRYRPI